MNDYLKNVAKIIFSLILLNALAACSDSDEVAGSIASVAKTEMPPELQKLLGTDLTNLRAFVTVDGDTANRTEMTISTSGTGSASASIPGLTLDMHTIIITYEYTDGSGNTFILATATNTVDLSSGDGSISFLASDYDLASYDEDGDGISNADEVAAGSDPLDPTSGSTDCVLGTSTIGNCTLG